MRNALYAHNILTHNQCAHIYTGPRAVVRAVVEGSTLKLSSCRKSFGIHVVYVLQARSIAVDGLLKPTGAHTGQAVMGMVTSCCGRRPKKSRLHSEHDLMSPTSKKSHHRDISATYSANDFVMSLDQLNINQATEEELMTLPAISRNIARNIIQYRNHIGGFRKAEDLALVTGVGANKLALFRMEIYCGKYNPGSQCSPSSSRKSYHHFNTFMRQSPDSKTDVNKATETELRRISGIGDELAHKIVEYRNEYGLFKFLTDVSKVPEIGTYHFEKIRHLLTIDDAESTCSTSTASVSAIDDFPADSVPLLRDRPNGSLPSGGPKPKKTQVTSSTQTEDSSLPPSFATLPRRKSRSLLRRSASQRIGRVRLASWNLQKLSLDKIQNPGVREVICMTILETGISLLACQDVLDSDALHEICAELNNPKLAAIRAWSGVQGKWASITANTGGRTKQGKAMCGFVWDTSQCIHLKHSYQLKLTSNRTISTSLSECAPFLGRFTVPYSELSVLCVPVNRRGGGQICDEQDVSFVEAVAQTLEQYFPDKERMVIACDALPDVEGSDFSCLTMCGFVGVSLRGRSSNGVHPTHKAMRMNSILLSTELHKYYKGSCGIVQEGLSHPLIPAGWSWGGVVSDHYAAWAELAFQL